MTPSPAIEGPSIRRPASAFKLLLWLKWTLMWRGYRRDRMKALGTAVMLIFFAPISVGLAAACWFFSAQAPPLAPLILKAALTLAYLLWLVTPLLGFPINESYDPTRLFVYPVSYRTIFLAAVVGGFLDFGTLLVMPTMAALTVVFWPSILAGLATVCLLLLFLLQTLATAQALMLALIGFLRSRRFRDITMVLLPLVGMTWYVIQQTMIHRMTVLATGFRSLVDSPLWSAMSWLPPGWAANGILSAEVGDYGRALLDMALLALTLAVMATAAAYAMRQLYLGDKGPAGMATAPSPAPAGAPAPRPFAHAALPAATTRPRAARRSLLPPALDAMVLKEWRYMWREPQYKVMAINMLYTLVIFGLMFYFNTHSMGRPWGAGYPGAPGLPGYPGSGAPNPFAGLMRLMVPVGICGFLLLASMPLAFNIFGGEGAAITLLFSFPTPRRYYFLGKNLAHAAVILAVCAAGVCAACWVTGQPGSIPLVLAWLVIALPVLLAAGNLISVRFPHRMVIRGQRWGRSNQVILGGAGAGTGAGCGYAFVYLGCYLATLVALTPAIAAIAVPLIARATGWLALTVPLALAYAFGLWLAALHIASDWVIAREPVIVEKIVPAD